MEPNVLDRLRRMKRIANDNGFEVRDEPVGGGSTWCELRGRRVLFLDQSQTAGEQIVAIRVILDETACIRPLSTNGTNDDADTNPRTPGMRRAA
ncbi:MAG: hypothetical protein AAGD07_00710 [Planctomycetota bacterium]